MKVRVVCSSEAMMVYYRTTWRYIPEDNAVHSYHSENLKSYGVITALRIRHTLSGKPCGRKVLCSARSPV
jgi:hypothetical protein